MRFKLDWASLIVRSKFTVFALFYFVFGAIFQVQAPRGTYIWRGDLTEGFLLYRFEGLIHGGACFRNFTVLFRLCVAREFAHDVHHMRCESRFDFFSCSQVNLGMGPQ